MKTYTREQLDKILADHQKWLDGNGGKRADLSYADLELANLESANLRGANLGLANLREANLRGANLREANLESANLSYANLELANLQSANLKNARYTYLQILQSKLGCLSDKLTLELMRQDCDCLPNGKKLFDQWVQTGECPFRNNIYRPFLFEEKKALWSYSKPQMTLGELFLAVTKELEIKI